MVRMEIRKTPNLVKSTKQIGTLNPSSDQVKITQKLGGKNRSLLQHEENANAIHLPKKYQTNIRKIPVSNQFLSNI